MNIRKVAIRGAIVPIALGALAFAGCGGGDGGGSGSDEDYVAAICKAGVKFTKDLEKAFTDTSLLSDEDKAMEKLADAELPADFGYAWSGSAFQEKKTGGSSAVVFLFSILVVFLILAGQYESWKLPIAVLLTVPIAVLGALAAVWLRGALFGAAANDIYFQIGLITLIGLASKNAILMVEFATQRRAAGATIEGAAQEAARLRFRPIVMTSLAFVLGVLPLVVSTGAGAASRHSIGTGVFGGMIAATFIAVFFIPVFYVIITRLGGRRGSPDAEDSSTGQEVSS